MERMTVDSEGSCGHAQVYGNLERSHFLCEVAALAQTALTRPGLAETFVRTASEEFCEACAIVLADADGALSIAAVADARTGMAQRTRAAFQETFAIGDGAIGRALRSSAPVVVSSESPSRHAEDAAFSHLLESAQAHSLIAVAVSVESKRVGALCFLRGSGAFDAHDVECALAAARLTSLSLENMFLRDQERRIAERSRFLARATDELFATSDKAEMLRLLLDVVIEGFADWAVAASFEADRLEVLMTAPAPPPGGPLDGHSVRLRLFSDLSEETVVSALREQRSLVFNQSAGSPSQASGAPSAELRSWMIAPLLLGGRSSGAIVCYSGSRRYEDGDLEILQELCRRTSLALEYAEGFARERRLTQTLQQATLPSNLAVVADATLSAVYMPAAIEEQVGGDWYDAFTLDDDRVLLTVGDVTGHGVQASVVMGKLRHALNVVALYEANPARVLDVAERIVLRRYPNAVATAFAAVIDRRRNTITFANAGHPPPLVRTKDGAVRRLNAEGLPIGVRYFERSEYRVETLQDVELILLYTDGLTEATRDAIDGERRLMKAAARDAVLLVADAANFIKDACLGGASPDDVAILVLNLLEVDRWTFSSSDQWSAQAARREFSERLALRGVACEECAVAELIFGELTANVARHAPGVVDIALQWQDFRPVLNVIDRGRGYDITDLRAADTLSENGRGLWLVRRLGARISLDVIPGFGTHTRVILPAVALEGAPQDRQSA